MILARKQAGVLREVEVDEEEDFPARGRPARRWQVNPGLCWQNRPAQIAQSSASSPAQLGRCRRHTATEGSEAASTRPLTGNHLRKLRKTKPLPYSKEAGWPK